MFAVLVTYFMLTLVLTGCLTLIPQQLPLHYSRFIYYIHGNETITPGGIDLSFATTNVPSWLSHNATLVEL